MTRNEPLILTEETVRIACPAEDVYAFVSNHENYARWYPGVLNVRPRNDLPHGSVGKIYEETLALPSGRRATFSIRVVEARAPDLFATEGALAPLFPRMEMRLTAAQSRETALQVRFLSRNRSLLARLLIKLLVQGSLRRRTKAGLARLKSILE